MQGQWKKITTPIGKKSGQPESSTTTLGNNNTVEAPVGVPPERSDEVSCPSVDSFLLLTTHKHVLVKRNQSIISVIVQARNHSDLPYLFSEVVPELVEPGDNLEDV